MKKLLISMLLSVTVLMSASAGADDIRPSRYHAECKTPTGVYNEDIYEYGVFKEYNNYVIITPLIGKKIVFTNAFCVITEY